MATSSVTSFYWDEGRFNTDENNKFCFLWLLYTSSYSLDFTGTLCTKAKFQWAPTKCAKPARIRHLDGLHPETNVNKGLIPDIATPHPSQLRGHVAAKQPGKDMRSKSQSLTAARQQQHSLCLRGRRQTLPRRGREARIHSKPDSLESIISIMHIDFSNFSNFK